MDSNKYTKFIKRELDPDPLLLFGARVTEIAGSVIAFAYGTQADGTPNIMGTGFSLGNLDDAGLFATCHHVMKEIAQIRDLSLDKMQNVGLIDKKRRIAFLDSDHFEWKEVGPIRFSDKIQRDGINLAQKDDACICRVPGIKLQPLELSPDEYFIGTEVGIIGFPFFERLQTLSVQPYVLRAILSCNMRYPLERDDGKLDESERIALDCMAGKGFSGSPVFSIRDGRVVGMVDYLPTESYIEDLKIKSPVCEERDVRVHYAAGISFAVPSKTIKKFLDGALLMDWQKPGDQEIKM
jgi:hypothetical protein